MIKLDRKSFDAALALAAEAVEKRNTIPVLANARLTGGDGRLTVTTTNLDMEIAVSLPAAIDGAPDFTCPAGTLREIVRKADGALTLTPDTTQVKIAAGRSRFTLNVLPASDFPQMTAKSMCQPFAIDCEALAAAIGGVAHAISTEETRYYLNGIFIERTETGIALTATDGHRLAHREIALAEPAPDFPGVILPRNTVRSLQRLIAGHDTITAEIGDSLIRFAAEDRSTVLTSKLIDGTFPDYRRVIPAEGGIAYTLTRETLEKALDRVMTISGDRGRGCLFAFEGGRLQLTAKNPDAGDATEDIDVEGDGEMAIGFNGKYALEMLASISAESLVITMTDSAAPARITVPARPADVAVLMPMRV